MFNLQGSELIIILLLALVVLGPEKLPDAMRKAGQFYAELKKMSTGFQREFRAAVEEPLNELKQTANTLRDSADFTKLQNGERAEKPKSAEMVAAPDPDAVPSEDVPFQPTDADRPAAPEPGGVPPEDAPVQPADADRLADLPDQQRSVAESASDDDARPDGYIPPPPPPFSSSKDLRADPPPAEPPAEDKPRPDQHGGDRQPPPAPSSTPFSGAQQSSADPGSGQSSESPPVDEQAEEHPE